MTLKCEAVLRSRTGRVVKCITLKGDPPERLVCFAPVVGEDGPKWVPVRYALKFTKVRPAALWARYEEVGDA